MTASQRGIFVGRRKDRLGARILMLLNCIRLSEDYSADYGIDWYPQGADAEYLEDPDQLFQPDWIARYILRGKQVTDLDKTAVPIWRFQNDKGPEKLKRHLAKGRAVIVEEGFEVFAFPWEDPETIRPRYRGFLEKLAFVPRLQDEMRKIDALLDGNASTAYHIRRGDILDTKPWKHATWPAKIEADEFYHAHLSKDPDAPAILFSDTPRAITGLKAKYPNTRTIEDITDVTGLSPVQRDFVELYAMSRTDRIVAPIISAFSTSAARLTGRQRLMFRDVLTPDELRAANEALRDRMVKGLDSFVSVSEAAHLYSKLHQYLTAHGRMEEAYHLAARLLAQRADNAFVPILQALNCLYLDKLNEGQSVALSGLNHPDLWPTDFAVLCAILAAINGNLKNKAEAGRQFARAFWAKPLRPDVIVLGSRLVFRGHFSYRTMPPADWDLQKVIQRNFFPPFNSLYLVQWKMIRRRPANLDLILLDWHDLALDQRARRILDEPDRLLALKEALEGAEEEHRATPAARSLAAMLDFRLGGTARDSVTEIEAALGLVPTHPLHHMRLAVLLEEAGDTAAARMAMTDALATDPQNPFLLFAAGQMFRRTGQDDRGDELIVEASRHDSHTAAIQGEAGRILMKAGDLEAATAALRLAQKICPTYGRYGNQIDRIRKKRGKRAVENV